MDARTNRWTIFATLIFIFKPNLNHRPQPPSPLPPHTLSRVDASATAITTFGTVAVAIILRETTTLTAETIHWLTGRFLLNSRYTSVSLCCSSSLSYRMRSPHSALVIRHSHSHPLPTPYWTLAKYMPQSNRIEIFHSRKWYEKI